MPSFDESGAWLRQIRTEMARCGLAVPYAEPPEEVVVHWPDGAFRCDSSRCREICCTAPSNANGVALNVRDLLWLQQGSLGGGAHGSFSPRRRAHELLNCRRAGQTLTELRACWDAPRLAMRGGLCVYFEPQGGACRFYARRPRVCRSFPVELSHDQRSDVPVMVMSTLCSLVEAYAWATRGAPGFRRHVEHLTERRGAPTARRWAPGERSRVRLDALDGGDRDQVVAAIAREADLLETLYIVANRSDDMRQMGLARFLHEEDRRR